MAGLGSFRREDDDDCHQKAIKNWKPIVNKPRGRPKTEWFDDMGEDPLNVEDKFEKGCWG